MKNFILKKYTLLFSYLIILTGCTASGALFKPIESSNENQSRVYLYRPIDFASLDYPVIKLDGSEVGTLKNLGFITFVVKPGTHEISVAHDFFTWPYKSLNFSRSFESGKTYYFRVTLRTQRVGMSKIQYEIEANPFPEDAAISELKNLRESN